MPSLFNDLMGYLHDPDRYYLLEEETKKILPNIIEYPVYDISNVVPLFSEINNKEVVKRPPHGWMWAEWRMEDEGARFVFLVLLVEIERETLLFKDDFVDVEGVREAGLECDEFYTSVIWRRYDGGGENRPSYQLGKIVQEDHQAMYCFKNNSTVLDRILCIHANEVRDTDKLSEELMDKTKEVLSPYNLPWGKSFFEEKDKLQEELLMYVSFKAFSLLHCKNVKEVDVIPDEALQTARRRKGKLPLYGYKILKLNVPIEEEHKVYGINNDEPINRFHMVRGHFKNLQHERYLNKGLYWWPSHWRGNPELGIVDKEYKIEIDQRKKYGTV